MKPVFVLATVGLLLSARLDGSAEAQTPVSPAPMEVTTDTPEYCLQLADKVHNLVRVAVTQPSREVSDLSFEGQRMCEQGQTRGGIMRLRKAIMLMKHNDREAGH